MTGRLFLKLASGAAAAAAAVALPALAHPHPEPEKVERIIIMEDGHKGPNRERLHALHRDGIAKCEGEKTEIDETTGGDPKEKTRVVFCHKAGASAADQAKHLEKAIERLRSHDRLSAEHKAKVIASLEQALAKLRASN